MNLLDRIYSIEDFPNDQNDIFNTYNFAIPAFRTAAAHALMAVNKVLSRMVNSPLAPGNFFFCSRTKLVTVTQSVSIEKNNFGIHPNTAFK